MAQLKLPWKFNHGFKYNYARDTWLTQSCKCPTLEFALDHILMLMTHSFGSSSVLCIESSKNPLILSPPFQCSHYITLSLKKNHYSSLLIVPFLKEKY